MRWMHVTIVGKLGTVEGVAHTMNFRTSPTPDVEQDANAVRVFAEQVRDKWTAFFKDHSIVNIDELFTNDLEYTEVRAAYLEQLEPATIAFRPGKRGPVKVFNYPRPNYLVPTQYAPFGAGAVKGLGSGVSLPWEVSCCLSLKTPFRGPRNRGRLYLPPMVASQMQAGGLFNTSVQQIGRMFGEKFVAPITATTGNDLHVVSRAYATSVPVTGVATGLVPDSQRRRRRSQPEQATTGWGA